MKYATKIFRSPAAALLAAAVLALCCASCRDDMYGKTFLTSDAVMIDEYIMQEEEQSMSAFLEIADRANFRDMLHAYGIYTCFVPSNEAVSAYLQAAGVPSVAELPVEECAQIVKYHVVRHEFEDQVAFASTDFVNGRLPLATMLAKYLTTRTVNDNGSIVIQVNRQAKIVQRDIQAANGYIHKIDCVLIPPPETCGERIAGLPDGEYSIFKEIMRVTGWIDSLSNKADSAWYSVLVQSNAAFLERGIPDADSLARYLRKALPSVTGDSELLWYFAAYHCLRGLFYVVDLSNASALQSLAPNQALTFKVKGDSLLVNEYINKDIYERGIPVSKNSEYTDLSCYNGVLLEVDGYVGPQTRGPQAVFWDVAEQPEILKDSRFRKSGFGIPWDVAQTYSEIKMTLASGMSSYGEFGYGFQSAYSNNWQVVNRDYLTIRWYRLARVDFTLPLLTEGIYKVWVCFRRADVTTCRVRATLMQDGQDDQPLGVVNFSEYYDTETAAATLEGAGMKRYMAKERRGELNARLWGVIEVKSTGRHTLRCDVIDRGRNTDMFLDMIQFIPVNDDQLWPRFDMMGNAIYRGTPCEEIWPKDKACSTDNDDH
ncbi:MAG: fasciclin domain-containing protein [Prevotellaceae bacterium]|jgi:uncharacterized surface protein with fasciclin (FAS1) repeats|nr:fasciclin domain-containing protein [Prevotellaceae bacterium]